MSDRLSTAEASEATGIPQPTIKHWLGQGLPIPAEKDSAGRWRFGPDALTVLRAVKELREQDRTFDTIRRRIDPELSDSSSSLGGASSPDERPLTVDERQPNADERTLAESLAAAVVPQLVQALEAQNAQAEKYARATYEIGELRATLKATEAERDRLSGELERHRALIDEGNTARQAERDRLAGELAEAQAKIAALEASQASRPWWKVWG